VIKDWMGMMLFYKREKYLSRKIFINIIIFTTFRDLKSFFGGHKPHRVPFFEKENDLDLISRPILYFVS
jgi:hypothetical protein